MADAIAGDDLDEERAYIGRLYACLDAEIADARRVLDEELTGRATPGTGSERHRRDAAVETWSRRLASLRAAERALCLGRLDADDGASTYVGRIGLVDDGRGEQEADEPLLVDWRAPAAAPFYAATPRTPLGQRRRRHFRLQGRELRAVWDERFDAEAPTGVDGALLDALEAPRGEAMADIVATITAEQDAAIRDKHDGVLVIEGGPGTGKTAVALHRVAYLLHRRRERWARSGVLVVGPNAAFLRWIGDVLPALGESDAVFAHLGELFPSVSATREDPPEVARVKGDLAMLDVLAGVLARHEGGEAAPIDLDDVTVAVDADLVAVAVDRARSTGLAHNPARRVFREHLGRLLVTRAVERIGQGWLDDAGSDGRAAALASELAADVADELRRHPGFHHAVEATWPTLTPQRLLAALYAAPPDGLAVLHRDDPEAWTVADAALLDEAAELVGVDSVDDDRRERAAREADREYAEGVLEVLGDPDAEDDVVRPEDVVDPDRLSERQAEADHRPLAERAAADRTWTYGHVVVDEAQEVSPMAWRVLARRCPSRSATVVGDPAQARVTAVGVLGSGLGGRVRRRRLTTNYRTPAPIAAVAERVRRAIDPDGEGPTAVRPGAAPRWVRVERDRAVLDAVADVVADAVAGTEPERTVVALAPGPERTGLAGDVTVRTPAQVKGLEFDVVVLVEPAAMTLPDLYVALTRATRELVVVHTADLPAVLVNPMDGVHGPDQDDASWST